MTRKKNCIAIAIGAKCTKQVHIMLYSLFYNNPDMLFECYILYYTLPSKELEFYKKMVTGAGYACTFIKIPEIHVDKTQYSHVTKETFIRLLIPSSLPTDVERVLYLDFDVIINGSLKELFEYPFKQYSILAVEANRDQRKLENVKRANKVPFWKKYFNAGVLVMDLAKMREDEHFKKDFVLEYLKEHLDELQEDDQGYLNHFLWQKARMIGSRYNYNAAIYYCDGNDIFERIFFMAGMIKAEREAEKKYAIIHFRGKSKPWMKGYNGQCGQLYCHYARKAGYPVTRCFRISQQKAKFINWVKLLIQI